MHWPFCKSKCPYCDFNSHVRTTINQDDWQKCYLNELDHYAFYLKNRKVVSIFFGGGTPSLADPKLIASVIDKIAALAQLSTETEITLEANPTSVEANKFIQYAHIGVNRVSIGVQSFNPANLKFLGREHSPQEALLALELAHKYFRRYSFDLIYALPDQSLTTWEKELTEALPLSSGHLSLYQLTIEKGTQFFTDYKRKVFSLPDEDTSATAFELTNAITASYGLPAYEVSNYATPGQECQHNLNYWRYGDYLGIGPGAHGRYTNAYGQKVATVNKYSPEEWLNSINTTGQAFMSKTELSSEESYQEMLLMGLRLDEGVSAQIIRNHIKLEFLIAEELLEFKDKMIRATARGILLLNRVVAELV